MNIVVGPLLTLCWRAITLVLTAGVFGTSRIVLIKAKIESAKNYFTVKFSLHYHTPQSFLWNVIFQFILLSTKILFTEPSCHNNILHSSIQVCRLYCFSLWWYKVNCQQYPAFDLLYYFQSKFPSMSYMSAHVMLYEFKEG